MNLNVLLTRMSYPTGVVLVLCAGMFWSIIPVGVRSFEHAAVWQILFYRSLGVLPLVYALIYFQSNGKAIQDIRRSGRAGLFGAVGLAAAYAGGIAAVLHTSIANAAFLFATAPFMAALLGWLALHEPIRKATSAALVIALMGTLLMVLDNFSHGNWLGDILALLSAVGFAVFTVSLRASKNQNSLPVVFLGALLAILIAGVMATQHPQGILIPMKEIGLALGLGFFVLGVGMVLCTLGSKVVPAAELALLCMTEVIFAPIWAMLFLSEIPDVAVLIGGGIVVFAIILNAVSGIKRRPPLGTSC